MELKRMERRMLQVRLEKAKGFLDFF